jgi:hypothetical protein
LINVLKFSKLECYQEFLCNPDNVGKRGVYVWGFCFTDPETAEITEFRPYYVGKYETNIKDRIKQHVTEIQEGTDKIIHKDILKSTIEYRKVSKVRNNKLQVVYDHAIQRRQHNSNYFPKSKLEQWEKDNLRPHVEYYVDNLYVTYLEVNNLDLGNNEADYIRMLERYVQEKLGDRSIARKTGSFDEAFSNNVIIKTNIGTEHLNHIFVGGLPAEEV